MSTSFSTAIKALHTSEIGDILKVTQKPEVISFAGGLPAPELFPTKELAHATNEVLLHSGAQALQYSLPQGVPYFREQIAARTNKKFHTKLSAPDILITSGSQQALDFSARLFLDPGDVFLCESPTYMAALSAFEVYGPQPIGVPTDEAGMIPDELEKLLKTTAKVKFIYVIPDFQNPTGRTWSLERRQNLLKLANRYEVTILEDNPYGELRFEGEFLPSLKSMDTENRVISMGTFSKIFCPGMRVGWIAACPELVEKYAAIKQGSDLHTSVLSQMQISKYLDLYDIEEHIKKIIALYLKRRDVMLKAMADELPDDVSFTRPAGGLFTWVTLPETMKSSDLLMRCLENNVAFVPGHIFYPDQKPQNHFRLNYSNMPEDRIQEGIHRLATIIKQK